MPLRGYKITKVGSSFCNPEWLSVSAELSEDISEVLPYLNAIVKNAVYTPLRRVMHYPWMRLNAGFSQEMLSAQVKSAPTTRSRLQNMSPETKSKGVQMGDE